MNRDLMFDVGQANEWKMAFRRGGWTSAEIKKGSEGNHLEQFLKVLRGEAIIVFKTVAEFPKDL